MRTGVSVCDIIVKNWLNEMRFTYRKTKGKLTYKQKKMRLKLSKEKQF